MASVDVEEMSPFPLEPDGTPWRDQREQRERRPTGCCDRFQRSVSKWMLPPDSRETYLQRTNCCPPPIFIILISVAELAVFIYYAVWKPQKQWVTLDEGIWESPLTYRADRRWEAWRFGSYMFVHAGVEHILGNLVMQLLLGIPLELVHKGFEVGMVYLAGVLAGSLASSIFDPHSALVGASGGVYALLGGFFMNAVVVRLTTFLSSSRASGGAAVPGGPPPQNPPEILTQCNIYLEGPSAEETHNKSISQKKEKHQYIALSTVRMFVARIVNPFPVYNRHG